MTSQKTLAEIKKYLETQFHLPGEQIDSMLPDFMATLKEHLHTLETALEGGNLTCLAKAGHTIKGALLNLGLSECAEIALTIEERGKEGDNSINFNSLVDELRLRIETLTS